MAVNCSAAGSLCGPSTTVASTMAAAAANSTTSLLLTTSVVGTAILPFTGPTNSTTELNGTRLPSFFLKYPEVDPEFIKILNTADIVTRWVALIAIVLSLLGNFAVILVIVKSNKLPVYKQLILHLAITDIVYSFFQIFWVHRRFNEHRWIFGEEMCKCSIMMSSAITCSMFVITFIAIERYRSILRPFLPKLSQWVVLLSMGGLWLLAIAIHVPFSLKRRVVESYGNTDCEDVWKPDEIRDRGYFSLVVFLVTFPLPLVILAFCYFRIVSRVMGRFSIGKRCDTMRISTGGTSSNASASRQGNGYSSRNNNNNHDDDGDGHERQPSNQKVLRHNKLIFMLSMILVAFIVTTTPNQALIMWMNFAPKTGVSLKTVQRTYVILHCLSSLVHLHSCINPIIYCLSDRKHRRELYELLFHCRSAKNHAPPSAHTHESNVAKSRFQLSPNRSRDTTTSPLLKVTDKTSYQLAFSEVDDCEGRGVMDDSPKQLLSSNPETAM